MEVRVPQLGEGVDSGTVVNILVKVGDAVKKNQTLIELESGKAVAPIPSSGDGAIQALHIKQGDKVSVGQLIATLSSSGSAPAAQPQVAATAPVAAQNVAAPQPSFIPAPVIPSAGAYQYQSQSGSPPPASPSVRAMARDLGIDLGRVRGTESGGRIGLADVRNYIMQIQAMAFSAASAAALPAVQSSMKIDPSIDFSQWGPVTKKPLTALRRTIAKRMHESWSAIPHVTQFDEADVTIISQLRKKYASDYEKKGVNLTLTAIILKAVTAALKKHPVINSSLDLEKDELVLKDYIHLGVAVDTDQGLIVPVIRNADQMSILELAAAIGQVAEKTRQRKISGEDLKGGTFTISNLGGIGGGHFTPIVNKPEVAILGIGRGVSKPVVREGKIEVRQLMPVCVSYDHRVIDGADGARFTRSFIEALEKISDADIRLGSAAKPQPPVKTAAKKLVKKAGKK
ncbi:MAG TPA: 2-oxo acid dehydrogenase subunit E2 [Candidatus Omnitrophota bacterium]|nr:branched-chain alpha-keto acid dehydrogenase subunit E2 [Candidatus Omnitrophota bacterium]HRK62637.1 2-oxo acid dehydrogenase subunit E2 [Candidatus Omnitrophota bacterium]